MFRQDRSSHSETASRAFSAHSYRRPATWAGIFISLISLTVACTDITRPTDQLQQPDVPRLNVSQGDGPKVATDKQDYYPGETVVIDGWDWTPGETVRLQVVHVGEGDNALPEHQVWDVTADANGYITANWAIALEGDELGATLKLTADGVTSLAHAEVIFTDLDGTVNLFVDAGRATAQTAFQWNATVYPRIRTPKKSTCYRLRWTDPSSDVTTTFYETGDPPGTNADPAGMAVGQESGTWSLIVDQRASGTCTNEVGYGSATSTIFFDVARAVIIGAGTSGTTDSPGGDQCVYQTNNIGGVCQAAGSTTMFVRAQLNDHIRSYVRFDLTTITPAIPAGALVTDAKVRLSVAGTVSGRTYSIQRADASWAEGTVAWGTQPGVTGPVNTTSMASTLVPGTGGGDPQTWVKWTVIADVQDLLNGTTNNGWRISDATGSNSASAGRFHTTENTGGCAAGVTTCKRTWPVLLIDYTEPPKLEFYTSAFTGIVGQCLGPIQVQSKTYAGVALAVSSDLTVNLTAINLGTGAGGTDGAGAFYSNSGCTTGTTTTLITSGNSISQNFYYRATHRGDGGHDLKASATGYTPDPVQTQTINKAPTTTTYTGDLVILAGNTFHMSALITSPYQGCLGPRRVLFRLAPDPTSGTQYEDLTGYNDFGGFAVTNPGGLATKTSATTNWPEGIYDLTVNAIDNDDCLAQKAVPNPVITVIRPGAAATGGGFLAGNLVGGGRVNFGFTVRAVEGSDPLEYKGQFLLMKQDGGVPTFRCKGNLDTYGSVPETTPQVYAASGKCDFQLWDPDLDGGNGDWYLPVGSGYVNQTFTIYFVDNGSGKGREAPPPDKFGFNVGFVGSAISNPSFPLLDIKGGNIDVKDGGAAVTGGGTKGGGKKG